MSLRCSVRLLVLTCLVPSMADAGTIYVNNIVGNDRANGRFADALSGWDGPVATLGRALQLAHRTDSISIANTGDPYVESATLDRPDLAGTEAYPFVIEGNGAVLRGAKPLSPDFWRRVAPFTYRYQPYRKGHFQLVVDGKPAREIPTDSANDSPPILEPLSWCAHRGMVYFRVEPTNFIHQYTIEAPLYEVGLGLHNARHVVVRNLQFEFFRLDGVAVTGNSRDVRLLNVKSTGNGRAGLSVSGSSRVQVGGLDLEANRVAERLELVNGRITELPEAQVPPMPAPVTWDLNSGQYVQILSPAPDARVPSTATAKSNRAPRPCSW